MARPRIVVGAVLAAFAVAVTNNFLWNRYWTFGFGSGEGQVEFQAVRFFVVSIASLGRT
ncbi:MAG TPA: GtrA family protein [Solirubrobacterales bacterium]|nr:GtrA family protein [Solirubrobacterales bacterium]